MASKIPGSAEKSSSRKNKVYDVYVSYSSKDRSWVNSELVPRLKKAKISIFIDTEKVKPGDEWASTLEQGLLNCRSVVFVLSQGYFSGGYAERESLRVIELVKQSPDTSPVLIPILLENINVPEPLSLYSYIVFVDYNDLQPSQQDELWEKLIKSIRRARRTTRSKQQDERSNADRSTQGSGSVTLEPTSLDAEGKVGEPTVTAETPLQPTPPEEEIEVHGRALSDTYSEEDLLGYQDYVDALADFIESTDTKKPITIGIDAPWGGGKTTIMHMLEKRLGPPKKLRPWQGEKEKGKIESSRAILWENIKARVASGWHVLFNPKLWRWPWRGTKRSYFYTVWFNAWKYDQEESLWAALVLEVLKQVRQQLGFWRKVGLSIKLNLQRFKWDDLLLDFLNSFLFVIVIALLGLSVAVGVAIASGDTIQDLSKAYVISRIKVIDALGIVSLLSLTYTIIKDVLGKIVSPFSLGIAKYLKKPDYESKIGFLGQFQEDFKLVVATVTENGKWPLLIFIDDLDRCTANKAAAVIESINLLLGSEYCVFVIGMDSHVLASSIQAKYKDLQEFFRDPDNPGGLSLGHKFLEKIIQIDFRVPSPDPEHVNDFIDINLGRTPATLAPSPQANEPERLLQAEQRAGKSLEEAKQAVQQSNPELANELDEAAKEIEARSFDDNDEVQKTVREAAPYLDYNPRKIKRYINLYRLQALIAYRREVLENTVSLDILGRWILIALRWPEFFDETLERPNLPNKFHDLGKRLQSAKTAAQRKTVLDSITGSALNQDRIKLLLDNQDIVQLLSTIPLTPDEVKNYLQLVQLSGPTQANEES